MAKHRFYLDPQEWRDSDQLELQGEEAHHCRDVMRCRVGELVSVFDGCGREVEAEITTTSKKSVAVDIKTEIPSQPIPARITLGQAIPKGKNMELIIQKATELGAAKVVPILSQNSVVQLNDRERDKKQLKWQRIAIEACKQCGQNWLPEVARPVTITEYISGCDDPFKIVAAIDEQSQTLKQILSKRASQHPEKPDSVSLLIGPEGDLSGEEVALAVGQGFAPMSLGPIILRSETAAIYTVSVLAYELMNR